MDQGVNLQSRQCSPDGSLFPHKLTKVERASPTVIGLKNRPEIMNLAKVIPFGFRTLPIVHRNRSADSRAMYYTEYFCLFSSKGVQKSKSGGLIEVQRRQAWNVCLVSGSRSTAEGTEKIRDIK